MSSINKVIIIGRLGQDPDLRQAQNGTPIANLSIATSERWTDKNTGEQKEQTEWHKVVLYNRLAEIAGGYLRKGSLVYIDGSLHTSKWQDQNGQDRYTTEIKAQSMQMLDSKPQNATQDPQHAPNHQNHQGGQWQGNAPQGYPQPQQPPQGGYNEQGQWQGGYQGQRYQQINGHPTTTPIGG